MKNIALILLALVLSGCASLFDGVEQEVRKNCSPLVESGTALVTYVWHDTEIVKSWYDDIETITDSIVELRQRQGDSILATLKKMK